MPTVTEAPLIIETLPFQGDFLESTERIVLLDGPWRSGKTHVLLLDALEECRKFPGNLLWFGRHESTKLRDSTIRDFHRLIPPTSINWHESRAEYVSPEGSVMMFRHLDDQSGLVNMDLGAVYIEQAEETEPENFDFLLGRLSRVPSSRKMRLSCNPNGHDWLWQLFYRDSPDYRTGYRVIQCPPADQNPHVPASYVEELRQSLTPEMFEQYVMGSRDVMLGYRFFDQGHLAHQLIEEPIAVGYFVDGLPRPEFREQTGGSVRLYERYIDRDLYVMGLDIATGEGSSRCAGVCLNGRLNQTAAVIDADLRPDELAVQGWLMSRYFGNALIAPERNGIGFSVVMALQQLTSHLFSEQVTEFGVGKHTGHLGWLTDARSRMELFAQLQREISHESTRLKDRELIEQAKAITMIKGKPKAEAGFRDDLVLARGIAGMVRKLRLSSMERLRGEPLPSPVTKPELGSAYGFGIRAVRYAGR